jgi:predicted MarR family transcription regulator
MEVQILHAVNHRERDKSQADLCMMFNIEDTHVVAYALKKLEALGLVEPGRRGKEKTARITKEGRSVPALPGSARKAAGRFRSSHWGSTRPDQRDRGVDAGDVGTV